MIKSSRNEVSTAAVSAFSWRVGRADVEFGTSAAGLLRGRGVFGAEQEMEKEIMLMDSRNVWSKSVDASFHVTLVACAYRSHKLDFKLFHKVCSTVQGTCRISVNFLSRSPRTSDRAPNADAEVRTNSAVNYSHKVSSSLQRLKQTFC